MQECQVHRMKYLICEFGDTLLTLVIALCSGVSVPLAPASKTGQAHKQSMKPYIGELQTVTYHEQLQNVLVKQAIQIRTLFKSSYT